MYGGGGGGAMGGVAGGGAGALAYTGAPVVWWIVLGIALLIAGVFLLHATRRRHRIGTATGSDR